MKHFVIRMVLAGLAFSFTGCASLAEKAGQLLDGEAFAEKTLALYRNKERGVEARILQKEEGEFIALSSAGVPALRFIGPVPEDGRLILNSLHFLAGSLAGWNEFTMDLAGGGAFRATETEAVLRVDFLEQLAVREGKIRHQDSRLKGQEALTVLSNRYERILAITGWMRSRQPAPAFFPSQERFEAYWKPILLPEALPRRKRPAAWKNAERRWARAGDIRWNAAYTEAILPEELWELRNSGALLRDWEEAVSWIYCCYEWERIGAALKDEIALIKMK
ncbi:MAG: hypothetical protein LBP74_00115 [Treponema sp.]|jgi:hypothetical protein|nr:hypothetical protein [Treponema sp.]